MRPQKTRTIDSYLNNIIKESVRSTLQRKALQEKELQDELSADTGSAEGSEPPKDKEAKKLKKGEISTKDVVDKLNSIRSGKSFKDEQIAGALEKYVNDMTTEERTALFAFLKGISQIVTGEVEAAAAVEPASDPAGIEMTKKEMGPKKVVVKPVIVKGPVKDEEKKKKPSAEDTSGPVPIKPKAK